MTDWDQGGNEITPKIIPPKKKWDDEDVDEDQIKETWDATSEEEEEDDNNKVETTIKKKKGSVAKKIAEKEEQKRKKAAEKAEKGQNGDDGDDDMEEEDDDEDYEDPLEKKKRIQQEQIKSDLENAESMFRGVSIKDTSLDKMNPKTREEFDEFSRLLCEKIRRHEKQPLYATFVSGFVKELCSGLKDVEIRKLSSVLSTLANEKTKATKEQKGKKKGKAKPVLNAEIDDAVDYRGGYDDFNDDDFM